MTKRDKALIKLMGIMATELVVIAAGLAFSNTIKIATGARRNSMFKDNTRIMKSNIDTIESIIKEATDDKH